MSDPEREIPEPPRPSSEFVEDMKNLDARRVELTRLYPDRFVVFYRDEVIGDAADLDELRKLLIDRGLNRLNPVVQYLRSKPVAMRLGRL